MTKQEKIEMKIHKYQYNLEKRNPDMSPESVRTQVGRYRAYLITGVID